MQHTTTSPKSATPDLGCQHTAAVIVDAGSSIRIFELAILLLNTVGQPTSRHKVPGSATYGGNARIGVVGNAAALPTSPCAVQRCETGQQQPISLAQQRICWCHTWCWDDDRHRGVRALSC